MVKRVSLEGRKRISELAHSDSVTQQKKAQLLSMKTETEHQLHLNIDVATLEPQPKAQQKPASVETSNPEAEMDSVIQYLLNQHRQFAEAGTPSRYAYTPYEQNQKLLKCIQQLVDLQSQRLEGQGMGKRQNRLACQEFVIQIQNRLLEHGIDVGTLRVTP